MGLRAIIGAALALGSSGVLAFAACSGGQPRPPAPASVAPTGSSPPAPSPVATAGPAPTSSAISRAEQLAAAVATARACEAPIAELTSRPAGGVVFNNAMTSADAGSIDRGQAVIDALGEQSTAFRCCFDVWLREHPTAEERVMLKLELEPDGSVRTAAIDAARSSLQDEVTLACVVAVAQDVRYPASPSDHPTIVEYPFVATAKGKTPVSADTP